MGMYTETEKYAPKSQTLLFLEVLGIVLAFIVFGWLCNAVKAAYNIKLMTFVPYLVAFALILYLYRSRVMEYRYSLNKGHLLLERSYGYRSSVLADIELARIISLEPCDNRKKADVRCVLPSSAHPTLLRYTAQDAKERSAVFSPSEKLASRLRAVLSGKASGEDSSQDGADDEAREK